MFIHPRPHSRSVTMPLLGSALVWLAPMGVLLAWSFGQWREKHPGVPFTDHLRADPHICALIILQICLWFIPLGLWLILLGFTLTSLILAGLHPEQRIEWRQRLAPRALAIVMLLAMHMLTALAPVSEPSGAASWNQPLFTESQDAPAWPASEQHTWLLSDGTIVVVTHIRAPGVVNPLWLDSSMRAWVAGTNAEEKRLQQSVALMDDWISPDAFRLEPVHTGVRMDYGGERLLFTHNEIMFDFFGERSSGEMITVWRPLWGGEVQLLTVIRVGPDPFLGNPGAQTYALDWLAANP